jgi:hypothetical protein
MSARDQAAADRATVLAYLKVLCVHLANRLAETDPKGAKTIREIVLTHGSGPLVGIQDEEVRREMQEFFDQLSRLPYLRPEQRAAITAAHNARHREGRTPRR